MNRIIFKLFTYFIIVLPVISVSQTKKTFSDTNFQRGDIIKVPNLEVELLNKEEDPQNDSLSLLVDFLTLHPELKVQIACYTDSRGNFQGNLQASQYRAQGIRDYLITNKHIDPDRLVAKGYGETSLIISDEIISKAPTKEKKEKLHLINRRIELIVL